MTLPIGVHVLGRALLVLVTLLLGSMVAGQAPTPTFDDVAPILEHHCTMCHSGDNPPRGLSLTRHEAVLAGSDRGPVVVPGDPDASELVHRIRGTSQPRMPLTGPPYLDDETIALIVSWIEAGAPAGTSDTDSSGMGGVDAAEADAGLPDAATAEPGTFANVMQTFQRRCAHCHAPNGVMGAPPEGFVVTSHDAIVAGTERPLVVPGMPLASELYRRVTGMSLPRMPFDGPPYLSEDAIARIRTWIEGGASGPDGEATGIRAGAEVRLHGTLSARWVLDGLPLTITPDTRIDDDPDIGSYVEVRGVLTADGAVRVTRIRPR
ncbi:MAG: c-type cytochrome domain-containing protein [Trueperaceae bacterium]|nr:c-type cytochrome domain-containing protein [Trueperaceae bacterium]